jgi:hypothetical protein
LALAESHFSKQEQELIDSSSRLKIHIAGSSDWPFFIFLAKTTESQSWPSHLPG